MCIDDQCHQDASLSSLWCWGHGKKITRPLCGFSHGNVTLNNRLLFPFMFAPRTIFSFLPLYPIIGEEITGASWTMETPLVYRDRRRPTFSIWQQSTHPLLSLRPLFHMILPLQLLSHLLRWINSSSQKKGSKMWTEQPCSQRASSIKFHTHKKINVPPAAGFPVYSVWPVIDQIFTPCLPPNYCWYLF